MTKEDFCKLLAEQGYDEVRNVEYEPGTDGELHTHEFSALLMVLEGELILVRENDSEAFSVGQTCDVSRC